MSNIQLKDVSDAFPDGVYYQCESYKILSFCNRLVMKCFAPFLVGEEGVISFIEEELEDASVTKILVKAKGKCFKDLNKPSVVVYSYEGEIRA